jgi:hypothetical protein
LRSWPREIYPTMSEQEPALMDRLAAEIARARVAIAHARERVEIAHEQRRRLERWAKRRRTGRREEADEPDER